MKKNTLRFFVIFVISFGFWTCNQKNEKEVIKIGAILPLTGPGSEYGIEQMNGLTLAIDTINKSNTNLEIIFKNSEGKSKIATNIFNELNVKNIKIYFTTLSNVAMSLKPKVIASNSLLVAIAATPDLTKGTNNIIRMLPTSRDYIDNLCKNFSDSLRNKKCFIIYSNDDFGMGLNTSVTENLKNYQISRIEKFMFDTQQKDFKNIILKIKPLIDNDDFIFIFGYSEALGSIIKQLREYNINNLVLSTPEVSYPETKRIAKDYYHNIAYSSLTTSNNETKSKYFEDIYIEKYHKSPSFDALLAYDAMFLIYEAIRKANNQSIVYSIYGCSIQGVSGNLQINDNGDVIFPLCIQYIK